MSENLQQLATLVSLAQSAPVQTTGQAASIWDDLLGLIGDLVNKLLADAIGSPGKTIAQVISDVAGGLKDKISSIYNTVSGIVGSVGNKVDQAVSSIGKSVSGAVSSIQGSVTGAIASIGGFIDQATGTIIDQVNTAVGGIGDAIAGAIQGIEDTLNGIGNAISNLAQSIAQGVISTVTGVVNTVADWITNAVGAIGVWISTAISNVAGWINEQTSALVSTINTTLNDIKGWFGGVIDSISQWINKQIEAFNNLVGQTKVTIEYWVSQILLWLLEVRDTILKAFYSALTSIGTWIAHNFLPAWGKAVDWAQKVSGLDETDWEKIKNGDFSDLTRGIDNTLMFGAKAAVDSPLFALLTAIRYFWNQVDLQFIPSQVAASRYAEIGLGLQPLSMEQANQAIDRGLWKAEDFIENARIGGVNKERAKIALELTRQLMPIDVLQQAYLRGEIDQKDHDQILAGYGFEDREIKEIKSIYQQIPNMTDLVHMADRWAFNDDIAKRFEYDTEYPDDIEKEVNKLGFTKQWFIRFWRAHWQLPSLQDVFEMFHRLRPGTTDNSFSQDDLNAYMLTTPYPPYFHERMKEIAYSPLTRVDIRRMYKVGVLTENQLLGAYEDIGYSPEKAQQLVDFTKIYSPPEDATASDNFKDLARSTYSAAFKNNIISVDEYKSFLDKLNYSPADIDLLVAIDEYTLLQQNKLFDINGYRKDQLKIILNGYSDGLITSADCNQMLQDLGYEEGEAELEINLIDYNRQLHLRDTLVNQLHDQYVSNIIDQTQLISTLNTFNFMADESDKLIEQWEIERSFRTRKPTLADFTKWLKQGVISMNTFVDEVRGLGYDDKYVNYYVASLKVSAG